MFVFAIEFVKTICKQVNEALSMSLYLPVAMGALHLGACAFAKTQRRVDERALSAASIFVLAITAHALHDMHEKMRPLLRTVSVQLVLPAVFVMVLGIMQRVLITTQTRRRTHADIAQPTIDAGLVRSVHDLMYAVGALTVESYELSVKNHEAAT